MSRAILIIRKLNKIKQNYIKSYFLVIIAVVSTSYHFEQRS